MSVLSIEQYRQRNGDDILKVILKPTKQFPKGYFYADASDEELVRSHAWCLKSPKQSYVITGYRNYMGAQHRHFHREKAHNILSWYPDCINHINGIGFDNIDFNLDVVTNQQNCWCRPTRGYRKTVESFEPYVAVNYQLIHLYCVRTEVEACQSAYFLESKNENYRYDFLRDRRNDLDILDQERIGRISIEEAVYRHVYRYALDNAWYYFRYNLADYFADNHLRVPSYSIDSDGFMIHSITGQRLCPL